ncbi:MAG: preprotein translocase subunit SecG [Clostridia bacterium]|nr:preprotein translocase subunit SecG [Clostridia bacterium]
MALYLFGSAIMVMAIAIIACVSIQQGNSQGLGAMAGGSDADSYFSKNKNRSRDAVLSKITVVLSALIVVCVIAMNIVSAM